MDEIGCNIILFKKITIIGVLISLVFVVFALILYEAFKNKSSESNCSPFNMFFFGLGKKNGLEENKQNYSQCNSSILFKFFSTLTESLMNPINIILGMINKLANIINGFRKFIFKIRILINRYLDDLMSRYENVMALVYYLIAKIKDILNRLYATYVTIMFTLYSTLSLFVWIADVFIDIITTFILILVAIVSSSALLFMPYLQPFLPIIYSILYMIFNCKIDVCFDENTNLILNNNTEIKIKDIDTSHNLKYDGNVLSVIKIKYDKCVCVYSYKDILVTGSHIVFHNNKWIKIEDCSSAIRIDNYDKEFLYCIETDKNTVHSGNDIFRDYSEVGDEYTNYLIDNKIYTYLNGYDNTNEEYKKHLYKKAFGKDTLIKLEDDTERAINLINIGDKLNNNSTVIGIVKILDHNINLYEYKCINGKIIVISGSHYVFENNKWIKVFESNNSKRLYCNPYTELYSLITDDNKLLIGESFFTDYLETNDNITNRYIHKCVINYLNKN